MHTKSEKHLCHDRLLQAIPGSITLGTRKLLHSAAKPQREIWALGFPNIIL